jgi:hypothetical protein
VANLNAAALDRSRIVDAPERGQFIAQITRLLPSGIDDAERRDRVVGLFNQTFSLIPDIHARVEAQNKCYIRLSGILVRFLDALEMVRRSRPPWGKGDHPFWQRPPGAKKRGNAPRRPQGLALTARGPQAPHSKRKEISRRLADSSRARDR